MKSNLKKILFYYISFVLSYFYYLMVIKNWTLHKILVSKSGIYLLSLLLLMIFINLISSIYHDFRNIKKSLIPSYDSTSAVNPIIRSDTTCGVNINKYFEEILIVLNYLLTIGIFFLLAGLLISLNLRQSYKLTVCEGQNIRFKNLAFKLDKVNIGEFKRNILLSKRVEGILDFYNKKEIITLFPPKRISKFYIYITNFGFAPHILIKDKKKNKIFAGYVLLGTFLADIEDIQIVERVKAPQVMLGVGYFPPVLDDLFKVNKFPYKFFLKIREGEINNKVYDLKGQNYYLYITKGKLKNPEFYLMVLKGRKILYRGNIKKNREIEFEGGSIYLDNKLRYYLGIQVVRDTGLNIIVMGLIFTLVGMIYKISKSLRL